MDESYQESADCLLNGVVKIHDSSFAAPNSLELNFTCMLYLHKTYNGNLILVSEDEKEELQLQNKEYESKLTFSEQIQIILSMTFKKLNTEVDQYNDCSLIFTFLPSDTFTTREVIFNSSLDKVCVTCKFIDGSTGYGCHVILRKNNGGSTFIFKIHHSESFPTSCMNGLSGGSYELQVYDVDSEGKVIPEPAFSFQDVFIIGSSEIYTCK